MELNHLPSGYASHYCFRNVFRFCDAGLSLHPLVTVGCLPSSLYTFPHAGLGSGLSVRIVRSKTSPNLTDYHLRITSQIAL